MTTTTSLSLKKGENLSLSKAAPGLKRIRLGLGWQTRQTTGHDFDLDASAILTDINGKVPSNGYFVYYGQQLSADGSTASAGDNLTGGDGNSESGDDETITIDLTKVGSNIEKIVFPVTIYESAVRRQNFGMVNKAYIRVINDETNQEIARYDLTEEASNLDAMIFGEVYRYNNEWKFRAVGQGYDGGLGAIARSYGVQIS